MLKQTISAAMISALFAVLPAQAENVEIFLTDMLDNIQKGYCLDIAGGKGAQADPADGLQGHTCYSPGGSLGVDQTFDTNRFTDGVLYMSNFDVCAEVSSAEAGGTLSLAKCNGSEAQKFVFSGKGKIVPTSTPEMCLTLGEKTRFGRSKKNQIKALSLEACNDERAAYQMWDVRSSIKD